MRAVWLAAFAALAAADVEEITTEPAFKKALASNPAVVVDFFSTTCGPCIMIANDGGPEQSRRRTTAVLHFAPAPPCHALAKPPYPDSANRLHHAARQREPEP